MKVESVVLNKGSNRKLSELTGGEVKSVFIGLGWNNLGEDDTSALDVSAFIVSSDNSVRTNQDFIFYNQTRDTGEAISLRSSPPNNTDNQGFSISIEKLEKNISKIFFCISVDEENSSKSFNVSSVKGLYIRVLDGTFLGQEIARFNIDDIEPVKSLMCAQIYMHNNDWKLKAIGQGFNGGLGALANHFNVSVNAVSEEVETKAVGIKHKRRGSQEILQQYSSKMHSKILKFIPQVDEAVKSKLNESNTRMLIDKIFMDILGYSIDEIKAEQKIEGKRADYILSINNKDAVVVEVKKAGLPLKDQHIFQAISYGAFSGIEWVLLTNLKEWKVFKITSDKKVGADMLFSVTFDETFDQSMSNNLSLISKTGMERSSLIQKFWNKKSALSDANIINAILSPEVLSKIKNSIKKESSTSVDIDDVQVAVENLLNIN